MKQLRDEDKIIEGVRRIHMIGIGGSGMCPLAEILHSRGYELTGSDNNESDPLSRIRNLGIKVFMGHSADNIKGAQLVVYSARSSLSTPPRYQMTIPSLKPRGSRAYQQWSARICWARSHVILTML